ncbi:MAG: hypothetical protein ACKVT2_18445 [Saprospiraceae bacterium]
MHKTVFMLALMLFSPNLLLASTSHQISADLFQDDLSKLECELAVLSELEVLIQGTSASQSQLLKEENPLAKHLLPYADNSSSLFSSSAPEQERLLDIPGFLWGFCCSFCGVLLVYVSIEDPLAKKKEGVQSIIGCAAGTAFFLALYIWALVTVSYY